MKSGPRVFAGKTYTPAEIVAGLQSLIDEQDATARKRAEWTQQVKRERALEKALGPFVLGIKSLVNALYGPQGKEVADFGIENRKRGPKTLAAKVAMTEKARATRIARGTKGKRQRKKIVG
jgi:hypothetical protein